MTTPHHPITPPPELVQQWYHEANLSGAPYEDVAENWAYEQHIANCAAQWGADQELEACCEWLAGWSRNEYPGGIENLRAARRPKPPSLAEEALVRVEKYKNDFMPPLEKDWEIIRHALKRLQQLEEQQ